MVAHLVFKMVDIFQLCPLIPEAQAAPVWMNNSELLFTNCRGSGNVHNYRLMVPDPFVEGELQRQCYVQVV
jgi:hypothetical protein